MSSPFESPTDAEEDHSEDSCHTLTPSAKVLHTSASDMASSPALHSSPVEARPFGTALQKYSKDLIKSLGNFKFDDELADDNYVSWSQAVSELLQSINLDSFITIDHYKDVSLTEAENQKTRFIVTTFILNRLDSNNNLQARNSPFQSQRPSCSHLQPSRSVEVPQEQTR